MSSLSLSPFLQRVALAASFSLLPAALRGQTCLGDASFAQRVAHMGADFARSQSSRSLTADATVGTLRGPFVSLGIGLVNDDNLSDVATIFGATAGLSTVVLTAPETEICPFLSIGTFNGANSPSGESISSTAYGAGVSLGTRLSVQRGFELVPFASAARVLATGTINLGEGMQVGTTEHNYVSASVGVGFVFQRVVTIRPAASLAISHEQMARSLAVSFSFAFGGVEVARGKHPASDEGSLAMVWVNPRAMIYYCSGSRWYGGTAAGSFMTEREALAAGYTPEFGKRCQP